MLRRHQSWLLNTQDLSKTLSLMGCRQQLQGFLKVIANPDKTQADIDFLKNTLQNIYQFGYFIKLKQRLSTADYEYFLSKLTLQHRDKNAVLIEKRKKNDYFYIILKGEVNILDQAIRPGNNNKIAYQVINTLRSGDFFGEATLINPKALTTARVVSKTEVLLLVANQQAFNRTVSDSDFMKNQEKLSYFLKHPLFQGIGELQVKDIIPEVRAIKYSLNEQVYRSGDLHEEMYFILQGEVILKNCRTQALHRNNGLVRLGAGQYFGIQKPELQDVNGIRQQTAISNCNELIVYRILFKRLLLMQQGYTVFVKNTEQHLQKKIAFHQKLYQNQQMIEKYAKNSFSLKEVKAKRKKYKSTQFKKMKPSLQWWGVTNNMSSINIEAIMRKKNCIYPELKKPQLSQTASRKSLLDIFSQNCKSFSLANTQLEEHSRYLETQPTADYLIKGFRPSIAPKTLKTNQQEETPRKIIKKSSSILPKIYKQELANYAKQESTFISRLW